MEGSEFGADELEIARREREHNRKGEKKNGEKKSPQGRE